jgi:hypothetical protein
LHVIPGRRPCAVPKDYHFDIAASEKSHKTIRRSLSDFREMPADDTRRVVQNWDNLD